MSGNMDEPRLVAVGDVSFGDNYACASIGVNSLLKKKPAFDLFRDVKSVIRRGDLAFVNLETVLSTIGLDPRSLHSMHMRGQPEDVDRLVDAGFNVVNVANNHMLQHGADAFRETVELLKDRGLGVVGVAQENGLNCIPYETSIGGRDVVFLGYGFEKDLYYEGTTLYAQGEAENVLADIRSCKTSTNLVVCSFHWGNEFISFPRSDQISLGRQAIEAGCDLVLGHHPHVLNGYESHRDRLILYSMGNFVFDQLWNRPCTEGCIVTLGVKDDGFHLRELQLTRIDDAFSPRLEGTPEHATKRFKELNSELRATIGDGGASYQECWSKLNRKNRHGSWMHMLKNIMHYDPRILSQLMGDTISKKLGLR